jgi:hypothetical protein
VKRGLFLRQMGLATLGLLTGAEALEAFERLTYRRKYWPGADMGNEAICRPTTWPRCGYSRPASTRWYYRINAGEWVEIGTWRDELRFKVPVTIKASDTLSFMYSSVLSWG